MFKKDGIGLPGIPVSPFESSVGGKNSIVSPFLDGVHGAYSDGSMLAGMLNVRAKRHGRFSARDRMRGFESRSFDADGDHISLAESYADKYLDQRVMGGMYNVGLSDIYTDKALYAAHFGLDTDGYIDPNDPNKGVDPFRELVEDVRNKSAEPESSGQKKFSGFLSAHEKTQDMDSGYGAGYDVSDERRKEQESVRAVLTGKNYEKTGKERKKGSSSAPSSPTDMGSVGTDAKKGRSASSAVFQEKKKQLDGRKGGQTHREAGSAETAMAFGPGDGQISSNEGWNVLERSPFVHRQEQEETEEALHSFVPPSIQGAASMAALLQKSQSPRQKNVVPKSSGTGSEEGKKETAYEGRRNEKRTEGGSDLSIDADSGIGEAIAAANEWKEGTSFSGGKKERKRKETGETKSPFDASYGSVSSKSFDNMVVNSPFRSEENSGKGKGVLLPSREKKDRSTALFSMEEKKAEKEKEAVTTGKIKSERLSSISEEMDEEHGLAKRKERKRARSAVDLLNNPEDNSKSFEHKKTDPVKRTCEMSIESLKEEIEKLKKLQRQSKMGDALRAKLEGLEKELIKRVIFS